MTTSPPRAAWRHRTFVPRSVRSAELTLCGSAFTAADVAERYDVDPDRLRVVPYAPALEHGDAPLPDGAPYLLAVGDQRPSRNLERLVAAFAALRAGRAARPPPRARRRRAGLAAGAGVEATGWLADAQLDALMRGADGGSSTRASTTASASSCSRRWRAGSRWRAARAAALPATCGDAAELFDPLDHDAIADAVLRARARRDELAAAGRERAALFTWDATAEATALVYRELL